MCRRLTSKSASARSRSFLPGALENSPISSKGQGWGRAQASTVQGTEAAGGCSQHGGKGEGAQIPKPILQPCSCPQSHVLPRSPPFPPSVIHKDEEKATTADLLLLKEVKSMRETTCSSFPTLVLSWGRAGRTPWFPPKAETGSPPMGPRWAMGACPGITPQPN